METYLAGLGVCLPELVSVESAIEQGRCRAEDVTPDGWLSAAVAGAVPAPELALAAARQAYARYGGNPQDADLLLYTNSWHQGPDGWQPQYYLQKHLVGGACLGLQIQHGRNGMFSAFELAIRYLAADPARRTALLVAADNFGTPMVRRWRAGPGLVVGDSAAAVILAKEPGFARLLAIGTVAVPDAEELHRAGEPMFPPGVTTGRAVDFAKRAQKYGHSPWPAIYPHLRDLVDYVTKQAGEPARVVLTNAGRIETGQLLAALDVPMERSTWEFGRTVGQLGAADQIVSLDWLLHTGALRAGDHVLLVGVGQGVTLSAAVIEIVHTRPWLACAGFPEDPEPLKTP